MKAGKIYNGIIIRKETKLQLILFIYNVIIYRKSKKNLQITDLNKRILKRILKGYRIQKTMYKTNCIERLHFTSPDAIMLTYLLSFHKGK